MGYRRSGAKNTVGAYYHLDSARLVRQGVLRPDAELVAGILSWRNSAGKDTASVGYTARPATLALSYRVNEGEQQQDIEEVIQIAFTACHYGGSRPWFLCPACQRRVRKLYLSTRWRCRQCRNLAYPSQRDTWGDRGLHKAQDIRQKLGGTGNMLEPFPPRPRYMHWRTYSRWRKVHDEGFRRDLIAMSAQIDRWKAQSAK